MLGFVFLSEGKSSDGAELIKRTGGQKRNSQCNEVSLESETAFVAQVFTNWS